MDKNRLFQLKEELTHLCKDVAFFIRSQLNAVQKGDIEIKDMNSLVSYVDKEAEKKIVACLQELTPEAGYITEEDTVKQEDKDLVWIIDPLDGTTNFLNKIPHFSISIALMQNKEVVLGIVYEIMLDIAYTAIKGEGAWENEKTISVTETNKMLDAVVVTGFPYRRDIDIDASLRVLKYCVVNCRGVRRLGSAALDLAYVAAGKIDIYYENSLNIWDIAAGALLVTEAGGTMKDYNGDDKFLSHGSIISSNPHLYPFIYKAISENLT